MADSSCKAKDENLCLLCECRNTVNWKCLKCSDSLCNDCKKVHEKLSSTKDHEVVSLEQYDVKDHANFSVQIAMLLFAENVLKSMATTNIENYQLFDEK